MVSCSTTAKRVPLLQYCRSGDILQTVDLSEIDLGALIRYCSRLWGSVFSKRWVCEDRIIAVIAHKEFVWRTTSQQAILIVIEYDKANSRGTLTVKAFAGGQGLLNISWGSHGAAERTVVERVKSFLEFQRWES